MCLIYDQENFGVTFSDSFQNQMKEPVFADSRGFSKLGDDLAQKSIGADRCQRKIEALTAVQRQTAGKAAQEGRFSNAGLPQNKGDMSLALEE